MSESAAEVVDINDPGWARFVAGRPEATCFHRPAWAALLAATYRYRAFAVVQRDASGDMVAGLPLVEVRSLTGSRRWLCLPFTDECGPLAQPAGSVETVLRAADALRRERGIADLVVRADPGLAAVPARQVAVTHTLALRPSAGGGKGRPRSSVRRAIAASERAGVKVRFSASRADLVNEFYRLHVLTRRRQGVPVQPRRYFRLLWEGMIAPGHGVLALAEHAGRLVAGAVYLTGGETVTYKYGASDERHWSLRPNHAVMAQAISWAAEGGYTWFDFGRSDLANPGLIRFKETWGAVSRPLRYVSFTGEVGYEAARRGQALLAPVIRNTPPSICRGLGELLYRYAA